MSETADFLFEQLSRGRRTLRVAVITETYPPEVNRVALTAARFVEGLRARGHEIQLVRPRQDRGDNAVAGERLEEVLTRGVPVPNHPNLRLGLPAKRALARLWGRLRPDVVHVLTEGPLGWSALSAARQLKLPVVSDFRTGFYGQHGIGWLGKPILAYLRKFHNRALWTLVPTEALCAELTRLGFRNLRVVAREGDTTPFDRARDRVIRQLETLLKVAACVAPACYGTSGDGRTRTPMPQST
jgi:hypothetical protein